MNLILFDKEETEQPLPVNDERTRHILDVLHLNIGDQCDVGLIDGPKGTARIKSLSSAGLVFDFKWQDSIESVPDSITLVVGLCRPHTNQKILQQATSMGVKKMHFVRTELGEGSYAASKLWSTGEYKQHLIYGAQQAGSTRLPKVEYGSPLWIAMHLVEDIPQKIALHNGQDVTSLTHLLIDKKKDVVLAIGSERGWSTNEIAMLQRNGFTLASMGNRILRTETAVVSGLALLKAARNLW